MEQIALLKPNTHRTKGPQCPQDDVWLDIAAGFANQDSEKYLSHAAECDHCGPLLRQAKDDFTDDLTPEEALHVASLPSAKTDWQRRLAQSLGVAPEDTASEDAVPEVTTREAAESTRLTPAWHAKRFPWKLPVLALAAIALTVIAVSLGLRLLREASVDQLLATAYTQRRTLEVRLPGAQYSPLRVERGAIDSNLEKPASLLKAEALISEKLHKNPNDPTWLQARARADLLDGNYDSAVKTLLRARSGSSDSVPLLTDLGSAYYMRGQSADRALDYGNAIEALGEALAKTPNDPIALFNRALACEQLFLYSQAVADWEHYLREDPKGEWAQEAREHLDALKQKIEKRQQPHAGSLLPPESQSPSFHREPKLQTLAVVLQNDHDDTWLKNFLEAPPTPTRTAAIRDFQASDDALSNGRYGNAIDLAHQSMREFAIAQDQAGMLRAGFASLAAQDFALRFNDCLATVATLQPLLARTRYHWLQAATLIEQGECLAGAAKLQQAMKANQQGWDLAKRFHYPELQLRATAFGAGYLLDTGSTDQGLRGLRDGLATFWQSDVPDKRGENLYASLFQFSHSIDWPFVDLFALKQLLATFPPRDPVDQAVERELLADAQKQTGDYQAARLTLQSASAYLDALPNDRAVIMTKAEIAVANAQIDLTVSNAKDAITSLSPFRDQVEAAGPGRFQAEYFQIFGEAYLAQGMLTQAQPLLERALALRETGLRNLQLESEKLAWSRGRTELYRDLLQVDLKLKTPSEALAEWEWYKGASLRSTKTVEATAAALPGNTTLISYALLKGSIIAFVLRDGKVHVHTLTLPRDLDPNVSHLLSLCSDPSSDISQLNTAGRQLYRILVAPVEADIRGATALTIETDGVIDQVPFNLLQASDGHYLGDKFEITFSQGMSYWPSSRTSLAGLSPESAALVVVASGAADPSLPVLPGADQEGTEVASLFHNAVLIHGHEVTRAEVLAQLHDACLLHFAGHAFAGVNRVGLVLGPASLLSSHDIATLGPRNLKLAVLSACDTANGDEGTSADGDSLARTLVAAGVPNVVASRWRVDSNVTRQLMHVFYSDLLSGQSPAKSLCAAKAAIRSIPAYQHPYYWASFAVFGTS
jgi:CHAT domain-containing protein/cytochrome c-type biogenesis protein CcmH/NrfG